MCSAHGKHINYHQIPSMCVAHTQDTSRTTNNQLSDFQTPEAVLKSLQWTPKLVSVLFCALHFWFWVNPNLLICFSFSEIGSYREDSGWHGIQNLLPQHLKCWNYMTPVLSVLTYLFCLLAFFCERVSLHSSSCPGTHYVDQADLKHTDICLPSKRWN